MSSCKLGSNIAAVAVNLAAVCTTSAALFGPVRTSANPNMLSQIKSVFSVTVQALAKAEGQKSEVGGEGIFRVPKSLDYMTHAFLGFQFTPFRIKYADDINRLATVRMKPNWSALLLRCSRLMVQDLCLSESDWFASLIHVHANVRSAHRRNYDLLMGNTPAWLTPAGFNGTTGLFDLVGDDNVIYAPIPLLAMPSGHHSRPFITGAAIFNDIRIELDYSDLADLVEITNGPCGTVDLVGDANGRAATVADLETCNATCPDMREVHVMVHGAVGSTAEKKALSTMSASQQIKVYSKTMFAEFNGHSESSIEVRSSSAAQALYAAVICATHGVRSSEFTAFPGSGQSTVETMRVDYENTTYWSGSNAQSILWDVTNSHDVDKAQLTHVFHVPFDHLVDQDHIRGVAEFGKISQVVVSFVPNSVAAAATEGFTADGTAIPSATGHASCVAGVQDPTKAGVVQRFTSAVVLQNVNTVKYQKSAVQLVL